jgi:hypothetical protein
MTLRKQVRAVAQMLFFSGSFAASAGLQGCASQLRTSPLPAELKPNSAAASRSAASVGGNAGERSAAELPALPLEGSFFAGERPAFVSHRGDGAFAYVAIPLPPAPALALLAQVAALAKEKFADIIHGRGEAHVTAITPPEFHDVLASRLAIADIEAIAAAEKLPMAQIEPVCVGRASASVEGRRESAYFVVLRAPDIVRFRRAVANAFVARGGEPGKFDPEHFFPHATIGFTKRDLFEEDGAIKNENSCWARLLAPASAADNL